MDAGNNNKHSIHVEDDEFEELNNTLTDEILPLIDESNRNYDEDRNELMSRLTTAQKKINKIEDSISMIKLDENIPNHSRLEPLNFHPDIHSAMVYMQEYVTKLEEQFKDLDNAEHQIANATEQVLKEIDCTYDRLASQVIREINHKRDLMRLEAEVFHKESLTPLKACRKEIKTEIFNKNQSIVQIGKFLGESRNQGITNSQLDEILNANSNIGGIPAVPLAEELPYLQWKPPSNMILNSFLDKIYDLGTVLRLGPVEIIETEEKPASVFVKWDITNPDFAGEEQIYILQKANGKVTDPAADTFETVYEGPETCTFVHDIPVNQPITLRIGIQSLQSAWSTPRVVQTHILHYRWSKDNKNYIVKNNSIIKISDNISTLFSNGPQIDSNQIIEYKFLKVPEHGNDDEGIALVVDPNGNNDNLRRKGTLMITSTGKIFMDGEEKLMRLPQAKLGTRIIFTILKKQNKNLRINIECDDKAVTYDWSVQTRLHFAVRFSGNEEWHLMVK